MGKHGQSQTCNHIMQIRNCLADIRSLVKVKIYSFLILYPVSFFFLIMYITSSRLTPVTRACGLSIHHFVANIQINKGSHEIKSAKPCLCISYPPKRRTSTNCSITFLALWCSGNGYKLRQRLLKKAEQSWQTNNILSIV